MKHTLTIDLFSFISAVLLLICCFVLELVTIHQLEKERDRAVAGRMEALMIARDAIEEKKAIYNEATNARAQIYQAILKKEHP